MFIVEAGKNHFGELNEAELIMDFFISLHLIRLLSCVKLKTGMKFKAREV